MDIEFHIEGSPHPLVMQYINSFQWTNGEKRVKKRNKRVGLEYSIIESWNAQDDRELGLMFEDDIEVSPLFFDFILLMLRNYVFENPKDSELLVGVSLTTPRYNEIALVHRLFYPEEVIGKKERLYAHQLPCSWGAVYFPWEWRKFLDFYHWRKTKGPSQELYTIPNTSVNLWQRSWKRYQPI